MINSKTKTATIAKAVITLAFTTALAAAPLAFAGEEPGKENLDSNKTITGVVVDMMCYVDHNAMGEKHASCAEKCIQNGGPVGIVSEGKAYLVVGDHKPMNDELAQYAGKTVTVKGKVASNGGMTMIENAEIVKN